MDQCPCGSGKTYEQCCQPVISGKKPAATAEALMRARYSAYAKTEIAFLGQSLAPEGRKGFDEKAARQWSQGARWDGLEVVSKQAGGEGDATGSVRFIARYTVGDKVHEHQEIAQFRKDDGHWVFVDGHAPKAEPVVRQAPKVGRNDPCPCGSGKKHKKCCAVAA